MTLDEIIVDIKEILEEWKPDEVVTLVSFTKSELEEIKEALEFYSEQKKLT